jgi:ssDNA-binding replication factor A large subunit
MYHDLDYISENNRNSLKKVDDIYLCSENKVEIAWKKLTRRTVIYHQYFK